MCHVAFHALVPCCLSVLTSSFSSSHLAPAALAASLSANRADTFPPLGLCAHCSLPNALPCMPAWLPLTSWVLTDVTPLGRLPEIVPPPPVCYPRFLTALASLALTSSHFAGFVYCPTRPEGRCFCPVPILTLQGLEPALSRSGHCAHHCRVAAWKPGARGGGHSPGCVSPAATSPPRYSTIYTMFPVFSLVLDKDVKSEVAMLYPELYKDLLKVR